MGFINLMGFKKFMGRSEFYGIPWLDKTSRGNILWEPHRILNRRPHGKTSIVNHHHDQGKPRGICNSHGNPKSSRAGQNSMGFLKVRGQAFCHGITWKPHGKSPTANRHHDWGKSHGVSFYLTSLVPLKLDLRQSSLSDHEKNSWDNYGRADRADLRESTQSTWKISNHFRPDGYFLTSIVKSLFNGSQHMIHRWKALNK